MMPERARRWKTHIVQTVVYEVSDEHFHLFRRFFPRPELCSRHSTVVDVLARSALIE